MIDRAALSEVEEIIAELQAILRAEGELDHMPGLIGAANCARQADTDPEMLLALKSLVRTMAGGAGSFLDLVIMRDDRAEMVRVNDRLSGLRRRFFDLVRGL